MSFFENIDFNAFFDSFDIEKIKLSNILLIAGFSILAYFIGNISPSSILGKFYGVDIRKEGSGNAGSTNALRTMGKKAGIITLIIDILKGGFATLITFLFIGSPGFYFAGFFVIIGHMWPIVFKLKGGKGVATALGTLFFIDPLIAFIGLGIVILLTLLTKIVSLSVLIACIAIVPASFFISKESFLYVFLMVVLIIIKHHSNIGRIFEGTENKISFGTPKQDKEEYLQARVSIREDVKTRQINDKSTFINPKQAKEEYLKAREEANKRKREK